MKRFVDGKTVNLISLYDHTPVHNNKLTLCMTHIYTIYTKTLTHTLTYESELGSL